MRRWLVTAVGLHLLAGFLGGGTAGRVDWRTARVLVLESDDWGLCGFVPCDHVVPADIRRRLRTGRVPPGYWESTLEDSTAVADLDGLLAARRGRDGVPAVLQANYILGWWQLDGQGKWRRGLLPELPAPYRRTGLWSAVRAAEAHGTWRAELHGLWHYDPVRRRQAVAADTLARRLAETGVLPFPAMQRAWELAPWRPDSTVTRELATALTVFRSLFDRRPVSVIAPDYVWGRRHERLWAGAGISVVQAKREQRRPGRDTGLVGRARKWLERSWRRVTERRLVYMERNARLETAQHGGRPEVLVDCLAAVRRAWRRGEPAVVECHRLNLVNCRPGVAADGRAALAGVLDSLLAAPASQRPRFAVDGEVAQWSRSGCAVRRVGDRWLVRNLTHSRCLVPVPDGRGGWRLVGVSAGETLWVVARGGSSVAEER